MDGGIKDDLSAGINNDFRPVPVLDGERLLDRGAFHTRIESDSFPGQIIRRLGPFIREERVTERLDVSAGLFEELSDQYGITIPNFSTRIIQDPGGGFCGDIIVDRVNGKPLVEAIKTGESDLTAEDLDRFGETFASYYLDKERNGGNAIYDLRVDQFMWGNVEGDPVKKPYYVDLDPMQNDSVTAGEIELLWRSVKEAEIELSAKFPLSRAKLLELAEELRYLDGSAHPQIAAVLEEISSTS
jgi:hypothetical protein